MSNSHTPGPWTMEPAVPGRSCNITKGGCRIAYCTGDVAVANGRLIAASPEQHALLKRFSEVFHAWLAERDDSALMHLLAVSLRDMSRDTDAAIAKAEEHEDDDLHRPGGPGCTDLSCRKCTGERDQLREINSALLVACKEALLALDGHRAMNSRGMIVYAITKAEGAEPK